MRTVNTLKKILYSYIIRYGLKRLPIKGLYKCPPSEGGMEIS